MPDSASVSEDVKTIKYNLESAFDFYRRFIYNEELQVILAKHNFHSAGSVPSKIWEVFAAILTGDEGKGGYGSDLTNHEVKSAKNGASFEYQYHLKAGKVKLEEDMTVNHIFISYSPDYKDVVVRLVEGSKLKEKFEEWRPGLIKNYDGPKPKQRYRKNISYGFVKANGVLILKTQDGDLVEAV